MTLRTLENIDIDTITAAFNLAFSDYLVPLSLTKEQLRAKFESENIALQYSVGAFDGDQMLGFILHFYKEEGSQKHLYNGGTGVAKEARGHKLTQQMYAYILPLLQQDNIARIQLEVLDQNTQAIKSYTNVGFQRTRSLACFKGSPQISDANTEVTIAEMDSYDWPILTSFWDIAPTWQNSIATIERLKGHTLSMAAYADQQAVGYIIYNRSTNRILQIAVDKSHRNLGIGKRLIHKITTLTAEPISIINVDTQHKESLSFFEKIGLTNYINQIEMQKLV